ncbi:uncharacterized protein L203_101321 [Cryptococcus depauperatus CBS 7841]|uniref:Uncharacterized protein n=1 Tax=Cryptococcus depauperatus CBS 7841 TaxID=1295531 RepID=A0A1E3IEM3_9TREE|nr:hypothetical protein L203_04319 [Cryptococcus depauperatus CBS 7841]ODN94549.1 hypothetical protein L204_04682 [Cryptococcus depauperatus CBS 7855]
MASSSGRIPQGEVIMDFLDGGSYIQGKLRDAVMELESRKSAKEEGQKAAKAIEALEVSKQGANVKVEDVDFISSQTGLCRQESEKILVAEKGDLMKALLKAVQPKPRAKSIDGAAL